MDNLVLMYCSYSVYMCCIIICIVVYILYTVVPPITPLRSLPPPNTAAHIQTFQKNKLNGKAKFLFCHYVATRVWGPDQL